MAMVLKSTLRYCILANPASGALPMDKRQRLLNAAAVVLQAGVYGLDTDSGAELVQCALACSDQCDVLVVAGGDGTFSLILNAIDLSSTILAFLPLGTGNALSYALSYRGGLPAIADRIRKGTIHDCDLINCDGQKKAFMASLGIDGRIIRRYDSLRSHGYGGLMAHFAAAFRVFFREYHPADGTVVLDNKFKRVRRLLSLMIVKQPYFGMGLKVVPRARWDDNKLHIMAVPAGIHMALAALTTGFTIGNQIGHYACGNDLKVRLNQPLTLQIDGELGWSSDCFEFNVLPRAMRLKY